MSPEEPFDITRPNEYQGNLNRVRVGGNVGTGVVALLCGVGLALFGLLVQAPWWFFVFAGFLIVLGSLAIGYWSRALRKSRPRS